MQDYNSTTRQRLIHSEDTDIGAKARRILSALKDKLTAVSQSPKQLMAIGAVCVAIGFGAASGAFNMKGADNDLAALDQATSQVSKTESGKKDTAFDASVKKQLKSAMDELNTVKKTLNANPALLSVARGQSSVDSLSKEDKKLYSEVKDHLRLSVARYSSAENQIQAYDNSGNEVSVDLYSRVEAYIIEGESLRGKIKPLYDATFGKFTSYDLDH